jgi:(p)ppGpp synthase/HD superfamily hydrolase
MGLSPRFEDALVFAAQLHAAQTRKGTTIPYVAHLLGTATIALEHGATDKEAIGALLHDAVEDVEGDPQRVKAEIRKRYGAAVLEIVCGCSDTGKEAKAAVEA